MLFCSPARLVALNESGIFLDASTSPTLIGPHRADIWSVAMDGTIQAWWEEDGEFDSLSIFNLAELVPGIDLLNRQLHV